MIKAIIFDIGNVLFRIDYQAVAQHWSDITGLSVEHINEQFKYADEHKAFERGEISEEDFAAFVSRSIGYELSLDQFKGGWNALLKEVWPGLPDLMTQLSEHYQIVCLSNTNKTHVDAFQRDYQEVIQKLDKTFYSHEIGAIKPQKEAFDVVLDYLQVKPEEAIFFDDLKENVAGAESLGINGFWVSSYEPMRLKLEELLKRFE